jgi:signal peptidase I
MTLPPSDQPSDEQAEADAVTPPDEPVAQDPLHEDLGDDLAIQEFADESADGTDATAQPGRRRLDPDAGEQIRVSDLGAAAEVARTDGDPAADAPPATGRRARRAERKKRKKRKKPPWWELPALVVGAIAVAILVKTFVVQPFYIPSESMEMTLAGSAEHGHDRILVNKIIYDFGDPDPGDIVVFHAPTGWDNADEGTKPPSNPVVRAVRGFGQLVGFVPPDGLVLVKRVIAVGGQTVRGLVQDGKAVVQVSKDHGNTWRTLNETYVHLTLPEGYAQSDVATFGPVTVPKGRLWVMGDHRDDSQDSRFHCGADGTDGPHDAACDATAATVPVDKVIGKAFVVAWPASHWRTLGTPSTFESAMGAAGQQPLLVGAALMVPVGLVRRRRRSSRSRHRHSA